MATWCVRHRRLVAGGWLLAVTLATVLAGIAGSNFSNTFSLPGTGSANAAGLLASDSPQVSGDTEQVVIGTSGTELVTSPGVRSAVGALLATVARIPHVTQVVSPYSAAGAGQIAAGRQVAYATVTFDQQSSDVSAADGKLLLNEAAAARRPGLAIAVGGQVAEQSEAQPLGGTDLGIIAAAIVLALVFGSLFATVLPLISAIISLGTAVGAVELLSRVVSIPADATVLMALVGLGVGVDYALFVVSRHRQELQAGRQPEASIITAMTTSGRAVLYAGIVVCTAVLGMFTLGVDFFNGLAIATAIGVALSMAAALTLLPALLGFLGPKVLSRRQRTKLTRQRAVSRGRSDGTPGMQPARSGFWERWASLIARRPALPAIGALAVLAVMALPLLSLRLGSADQGSDPAGSTTRQAYDMLAQGFGPGFNGPLTIAAVAHGPAQLAAVHRLAADIAAQRDVAHVAPPELIPVSHGSGEVAVITAFPATAPQAAATATLLAHLRDSTIPAATRASGLRAYVGGTTAVFADFATVISAKLPLFIGVIVALSFLIIALVFRSIVIPLTTAVMNFLSIATAFGVLVAVFQWGWADSLIGVSRTGPVESFLPPMLFAVVFGLSMDYQLFLLTRIQSTWKRSGDNKSAVKDGITATGRTITSAALIMVVVFISFALGPGQEIKEFGVGLAAGVLIDAVIIRSAIIPSLMLLLGRANWWFPRRLDRVLPPVTADKGGEAAPLAAAP
ncbi:MAG TPA: MMPL family transporter [Streptosporangiaceae bacterium]|nr:MMPL family transporter [Streptosporangiaceae bacterium]